jgi:hypothetical protein
VEHYLYPLAKMVCLFSHIVSYILCVQKGNQVPEEMSITHLVFQFRARFCDCSIALPCPLSGNRGSEEKSLVSLRWFIAEA